MMVGTIGLKSPAIRCMMEGVVVVDCFGGIRKCGTNCPGIGLLVKLGRVFVRRLNRVGD